MNQLSEQVAKEFCKLCNWAYEAWCTHRQLFDDNPFPEETIAKCRDFTIRLSIITQEYCLQQIAKLHDRALMHDSFNLSIEYIKKFGKWDDIEIKKITTLCNTLNDLYTKIRLARNKAIAHNDLKTLMRGKTVGAFPENADVLYFDALQELVNIVHTKWVGGEYPFNDFAKIDVEEFLELIKRA